MNDECSGPIYPAIFGEGAGMLIVDSSAVDPDVLLDNMLRHTPGIALSACKVNDTDTGDVDSIRHMMLRLRARGQKVGRWIFNNEPKRDIAELMRKDLADIPFDFVVYDVEAPYKADEGGIYGYAEDLVKASAGLNVPIAVTSYGAWKRSIDFASFAAAGWAIIPQAYDSFTVEDAQTYTRYWPPAAIHPMLRQLSVSASQFIYRPEGLDYAK